MSGFHHWRTGVVAALAAAKDDGVTFEQAWTRALAAHPPRLMERGPAVPQLDDEVSVVDFLHDACRDAWTGRREELRHLPDALAGLLHDRSRPARVGKSRSWLR